MRDQGTCEDDGYEAAITSRDCTPVPRRGETADQLRLRLEDAERAMFAFSRAQLEHLAPVVSDQQVEEIVSRVAELVTNAVMVFARRDAKALLREELSESLRSMAATLGHAQ